MPRNMKEPITDDWGGKFYRKQTKTFLDDKSTPYIGDPLKSRKPMVAVVGFVVGLLIAGAGLYFFYLSALVTYPPTAVTVACLGVLTLLVGGGVMYAAANLMMAAQGEKQKLLASDMRLKELKEVARIGVAQNMPFADLQRLAHAANLTVSQFTGVVLGQVIASKEEFEHYKQLREDQIRREEANRQDDRAREEFGREAERSRWTRDDRDEDRRHRERLVEKENDNREAEHRRDLAAKKAEYDHKMDVLDKELTNARRLQTMKEVSNIRAAMIGSLMELRNNPALSQQINEIVAALNVMQEKVDAAEDATPEGIRNKEMLDTLLTQLLFTKFGPKTPSGKNGSSVS